MLTKEENQMLTSVGRGTATFDGLSIAWAVAEHLHDRVGARTLFATHYHELVDLAVDRPTVSNLHVTAREWKDDIIFLHKILPGRSDRSYGIQVARLAGMPAHLVRQARATLEALEQQAVLAGRRPASRPATAA